MSINRCMDFDYLICCGDSFTEGCQDLLDISMSETWPGLLGSKLGIPVANLASGGSSNYDIALQPVQKMHQFTTENPPKKPLFIFAFTIDHRIPYYDVLSGSVQSFYTVLPEHIDSLNNDLITRKIISSTGALSVTQRTGLVGTLDKTDPVQDYCLLQTNNAIKVANNYANLYKDATVVWGFIHSYSPNDDVRTRIDSDINAYSVNFPYWQNCFNIYNDNKPLQNITNSKELWISKNDCHPNKKGLDHYSNWFYKFINTKFA